MSLGAAVRTTILCFTTLVPVCAYAEDIDTEHLFGFTIGTDVGSVGEREFQSQTTGRFSKTAEAMGRSTRNSNWSSYPSRTSGSRWEVPLRPTTSMASPGLMIAISWIGRAFRWICAHNLLDRKSAPFGLTFALETRADRYDDVAERLSGQKTN